MSGLMGELETGQPGRPSVGPRSVCWKMPPRWPGRDPACRSPTTAPAPYPTSMLGSTFTGQIGKVRLSTRLLESPARLSQGFAIPSQIAGRVPTVATGRATLRR